jgi:hypothetical protein
VIVDPDWIAATLERPLQDQRAPLLDIYREVYATYGKDWDANTETFADDYVFEGRGSVFLPGLPERIEGRDGYIAAQKQLLEVVDIVRVDIDDLVPLGEDRVAVFSRFVVRAGDGAFDQQVLELHEYRDGRLRRQIYWFDREEGLRELGLTP